MELLSNVSTWSENSVCLRANSIFSTEGPEIMSAMMEDMSNCCQRICKMNERLLLMMIVLWRDEGLGRGGNKEEYQSWRDFDLLNMCMCTTRIGT